MDDFLVDGAEPVVGCEDGLFAVEYFLGAVVEDGVLVFFVAVVVELGDAEAFEFAVVAHDGPGEDA